MINWVPNLDVKIQAGLISAITSIIIFILGWVIKFFYERFALNHKLNKEFQFEQRKKLKEEIAINKVHLLNSAEELNHRLWNFSQNVDKCWHNIDKKDWLKPSKYYINSFVYRFLVFIHWLIEAERKTLSIDTTIADSRDILYLKYIKTLKDIFTDADLFEGLNYDNSHDTHHFYKNDLIGYSKAVIENHRVLDFDEFQKKWANNITDIYKIFGYFSEIEDIKTDKILNILKCSHLLIISFLNNYGHDYQKTPKDKITTIIKKYKNEIIIVSNFEKFIKKSKITKELNPILKRLKK